MSAYRMPTKDVVKAARATAATAAGPGRRTGSPAIFYVSVAQVDRTLETDALIRLVALCNLEYGLQPGSLCLYDVDRRDVTETVEWLRRITSRAIEPAVDLNVERLCGLRSGAAILATPTSLRPPHLIAAAFADMRAGECWIFRSGGFCLARRADLDALYALSERFPRGRTR